LEIFLGFLKAMASSARRTTDPIDQLWNAFTPDLRKELEADDRHYLRSGSRNESILKIDGGELMGSWVSQQIRKGKTPTADQINLMIDAKLRTLLVKKAEGDRSGFTIHQYLDVLIQTLGYYPEVILHLLFLVEKLPGLEEKARKEIMVRYLTQTPIPEEGTHKQTTVKYLIYNRRELLVELLKYANSQRIRLGERLQKEFQYAEDFQMEFEIVMILSRITAKDPFSFFLRYDTNEIYHFLQLPKDLQIRILQTSSMQRTLERLFIGGEDRYPRIAYIHSEHVSVPVLLDLVYEAYGPEAFNLILPTNFLSSGVVQVSLLYLVLMFNHTVAIQDLPLDDSPIVEVNTDFFDSTAPIELQEQKLFTLEQFGVILTKYRSSIQVLPDRMEDGELLLALARTLAKNRRQQTKQLLLQYRYREKHKRPDGTYTTVEQRED
jgi:hypothetical protein